LTGFRIVPSTKNEVEGRSETMRILNTLTLLAVVLVVLLALGAPVAHAQTNVCRYDFTFWVGDAAVPGMQCYQGESFFFTFCSLKTYACPPAHAASETRCPECERAAAAMAAAGQPISLASGDTYITIRHHVQLRRCVEPDWHGGSAERADGVRLRQSQSIELPSQPSFSNAFWLQL
jgi:hypothetical protein